MQSPLVTDRGKLRMERLRQLELEQLQWEQEALVMPEDLNRALLLSFESVKTEFSDLDGLSWSRYPAANPWAAEEPTPKLPSAEMGGPLAPPPDLSDTCAHSPPHHSPQRRPPRFAASSRADMSSFGPQDTIRASHLSQPSRSPSQPTHQLFSPQRDACHGDHPPQNMSLSPHYLRRPAYGRG